MDGFFTDYQQKLYIELGKIQQNLTELKTLIDEDKKLLEKLRRKRAAKAEQRTELMEERAVIERMAGYTTKITELAGQKAAIKQEIIAKHNKDIIKEFIAHDRREEQAKELEEQAKKKLEEEKLARVQEQRNAVNKVRMEKLRRTFSPVKSKAAEAIGSLSPGKKYDSKKLTFAGSNYKEELIQKREDNKYKLFRQMMDNEAEMNKNHSDYMYKRALRNHFDMETVRMEMKLRKEQMEMEEATFAPKINSKSKKLAHDHAPFIQRAYNDLERKRQEYLFTRSKSYLKPHDAEGAKSEFKMGSEYHGHMYHKTKKWDDERRQALEDMKKGKPDTELDEVRDRPRGFSHRSKRVLDNKPPRDELEKLYNHNDEVYDRLYKETKDFARNKRLLEKTYNQQYSPFKPMINSIRPASASPARNRGIGEHRATGVRGSIDRDDDHHGNTSRTNSDEVLQGLLTDLQPGNANHGGNLRNASRDGEWMRVQELRVPKHQKEIIKDMVLHERYVGE